MNEEIEFEEYEPTCNNGVEEILLSFGIDLEDPNFKDTPARVGRMYNELFEGLSNNATQEIEKLLSVTFPCTYDQMIVIKDILCWSTCPHHLLPVRYNISIGYIPNGCVLGASKLPRLAILLAKRPVLQEQLTQDISQHLERFARPKGTIVRVEGQHLCMQMRGVKSSNSIMITSSITGAFKEMAPRQEFFNLLTPPGR